MSSLCKDPRSSYSTSTSTVHGHPTVARTLFYTRGRHRFQQLPHDAGRQQHSNHCDERVTVQSLRGSDRARFDEWHKNTCFVLSTSGIRVRPVAAFSIPSEGRSGRLPSMKTAPLAVLRYLSRLPVDNTRRRTTCIFQIATEKSSSLLLCKIEDGSGLSCDGHKGYQELVTTHNMAT